jgi:uncharacterized protein
VTVRAAFEIRNMSVDERVVSGIAVPWNETTLMAGDPGGERFLPGSLTKSVRAKADRLKLFRNHDHAQAIGRAIRMDPRHQDGLYGEWRIAKTPAGDAALQEIVEGMLDMFSIGFVARKSQRAADGVREVLEADLHETSLAPMAAYDGARVLSVRSPRTGPDELLAWLAAHPAPVVDLAPLPVLGGYSRRSDPPVTARH